MIVYQQTVRRYLLNLGLAERGQTQQNTSAILGIGEFLYKSGPLKLLPFARNEGRRNMKMLRDVADTHTGRTLVVGDDHRAVVLRRGESHARCQILSRELQVPTEHGEVIEKLPKATIRRSIFIQKLPIRNSRR